MNEVLFITRANDPLIITFLKALLLCTVLLGAFAYMTVIERRILARMQHRLGPNRVGPFGLMQPIADAIKSIFKEDITVSAADKFVYFLAPFVSITFALTAFGAIPAGPAGSLFGFNPWIMDLDIGLLFVLAATSIGVYGIFLAGWASNSKYSLLGSLRSSAQLISYELGLGLSVLTIIMIAGTLNLREIVYLNVWSISPWLWLPLAVAFVTFVISAIAEVNRTPFDLPEAEQEIVAGYLTEYSSIKWALFQMAEYVNMMTAAAFISTLCSWAVGAARTFSTTSFRGWRSGPLSGLSPRWRFSCSCSSGCAAPCPVFATTSSCALAGFTSLRLR